MFNLLFRLLFMLLLCLPMRTCQPGCKDSMDLVFVIDASVDFFQFEQMKGLVKNSLEILQVDENIVRVALFSYTSGIIENRNFSSSQSKDAILQFVQQLTIASGRPSISTAFAAIRERFLHDTERRKSVPGVVVLLSGGGVLDFGLALKESVLLRETHVSIVAVVVANDPPFPGFSMLASYPYEENFFYSSNLRSVQAQVVSKLCKGKTSCRESCRGQGECETIFSDVCDCERGFSGKHCNVTSCAQPVNVFFALTAASSIDAETFVREIRFAQDVIINLNLDESRVGCGVYFNGTVDVKFDFQHFEEFRKDGGWFRQKVFDAMSSEQKGGFTNLTHVVLFAREKIFSSGENNVLVIFVSGPSADMISSAREAALARNGPEVVQILVIAIGHLYSRDEVNAVAITPGISGYLGTNVFPTTTFHAGLVTDLVNAICNTIYECASNPCLNSGTCIDFINGYRCFCTSGYVGSRCERDGNEYMDLIFGFDSSGSNRNMEFENILNLSKRIVSQLEISPSKTRIGAVKIDDVAEELFHLDTFSSKQDVAWALDQIKLEPSRRGTNISDGLRVIKDLLLGPGERGERPSARNVILLFTNGKSDSNSEQTIQAAIELKTNRNARIVTFAVGNYVDYNELKSLCSIPPQENKDFFFVPSSELINASFESLFQTLIRADNCEDVTCHNGGVCTVAREANCICSGYYAGLYCDKYCGRSIDMVFVLDISGSGEFDIVMNKTINLAREIALLLPLNTTKISVVTFGNGARIDFYLKTFSNSRDLMDSLAFKLSVGRQDLRTAIGFLGDNSELEGPQIFAKTNGGRPSAAHVALIISSSDSPFEFGDIVQGAQRIRSMGTEIYAVAVNGWPNKDLYLSIVGNSERLFTLNHTDSLNRSAESIVAKMCRT